MTFTNFILAAALVAQTLGASPAQPPPRNDAWQMAPYGSVNPLGEFGRRVRLSRTRLEQYTPAFTFEGNDGWPGDREGRALLGQVLLARATGLPSKHADALVAGIKARLNDRGYMGAVVPKGVSDEQVLSSHSWLLRGLIAYQQWRQDEASLQIIRGIVNNLLLPSRAHYAQYPLTADQRPRTGNADGTIVGKPINGWRLSSDIGCAFIMLDGATSAYELLPSPELKTLIELMISRFAQMDLVAVNAQTHASLSAARAIVRFAPHAKQSQLVTLAARVFQTYKQHGMTEHYANDNWFGRPLWTEGCAIIDSFDLAMLLWQATGEVGYLEDAQNIYFNGMGYNQRPNGGFGCDSCPGKNAQTALHPKDPFEAYFCCSMRGGDGLARATSWAVMTRDNEVLLTSLHDLNAELAGPSGAVAFSVTTAFPIAGKTMLRVTKMPATSATFKIFLPAWIAPAAVIVKINGKASATNFTQGMLSLRELRTGSTVEFDFPITLRSAAPVNAQAMPEHHVFRHGPLVLGVAQKAQQPPIYLSAAPAVLQARRGRYTLQGKPRVTLMPVAGLAFLPEKAARAQRHQVLFQAPRGPTNEPCRRELRTGNKLP